MCSMGREGHPGRDGTSANFVRTLRVAIEICPCGTSRMEAFGSNAFGGLEVWADQRVNMREEGDET